MNFSSSLQRQNRKNFSTLLEFLSGFGRLYGKELEKLPYHINLIDELHAGENAHSRIFAKLLAYHQNSNFPFLEKFLKEVCKFELAVDKPQIMKVDSCGRIDIPICDNSYFLIIENKVTDKAADQNNSNGGQLARYIEHVKESYGRKLEEIYMVYTPKFTREPSEESWIGSNGFSYRKSFSDRFVSLSYRDIIYPWLKNDLMPVLAPEDKYLQSAVEQYIDHLEGMFNLRAISHPMNMKLQEFIKQELEIQENNLEQAVEILSEKEEEINNALAQIQLLKSSYKRKIIENQFAQWRKMLKESFPSYEIVGDNFVLDTNMINIGIKFTQADKSYAAVLECNNIENSNLYFGIGRHYSSMEKFETSEKLKIILNRKQLSDPENFWYGWKYTSMGRAYIELKDLMEEIIASNHIS